MSHALAPLVALPLRVLAEELGLLMDEDSDDSDWNFDIESSPLAARARRRIGGSKIKPAGRGVGFVVLFPVVPVSPTVGGRTGHKATVPDSMEEDDSESDDGLGSDPAGGIDELACGGGGRAGWCGSSCGEERKRLAKRDLQALRAEEVRKS